ncbi:hypothetical protein [Clostridium estertheticum]|uniref:hypothetical protein n=1 Tax=Clostridium estertheticum TaxID=238834 RepID=UPI001C0BCC0D|nr:hypothetical protein [Clostridium estertheticum]MBU3185946.1 hypothetical protein [Clostridium estertheticum]MCB2343415.1 hypothetical protein [Clostridium estertheticum]
MLKYRYKHLDNSKQQRLKQKRSRVFKLLQTKQEDDELIDKCIYEKYKRSFVCNYNERVNRNKSK